MSTNKTLANNETTVGGWSPYGNLSPDDKQIFDEAMRGFVGVTYTPQSVSKQVVEGMLYRFKCNASIPPAEVVWEAIVEIFKPLKGKPYITQIIKS